MNIINKLFTTGTGVGILVSVLIAVVGIIYPIPIHDFFIEKWGSPLEIKPSSKDIFFSRDGNNWDEDFYAYLINNTSNTYYGVQIVVDFPNSVDVTVISDVPGEFSMLGTKNNGISVSSDFVIVGEGKNGTNMNMTVINNIGPNEKKKFKIIIDKNDYKNNFRLDLKINRFNKEPKPILNR